MGKLVKKLLESLRLTDEDDDFEEDDEVNENNIELDETEALNEIKVKPEGIKLRKYENNIDEDEEEENTEAPSYRRSFIKNSYSENQAFGSKKAAVPLRSTISDRRIYVLNPKSFEDAKEVCETLKVGGVIFLNFEGVKYELAQRLMDFAGGTVYALNGQIYQVTGYSFIVAPSDMDIEGDILEKITTAGNKFPTFTR